MLTDTNYPNYPNSSSSSSPPMMGPYMQQYLWTKGLADECGDSLLPSSSATPLRYSQPNQDAHKHLHLPLNLLVGDDDSCDLPVESFTPKALAALATTAAHHTEEAMLPRQRKAMLRYQELQTLLHLYQDRTNGVDFNTIIHGFLEIFDGCGKRGHGKIWLDIMSSLTQASFDNGVLDKKTRWKVDLRHSLATELIANKLPTPDQTTLKGWHMTKSDIQDDIELLIRGEENIAVAVAQEKASGLLGLYNLTPVAAEDKKDALVKVKSIPSKRKRLPTDQGEVDPDSSHDSEIPINNLTDKLKGVKIKRRTTNPKRRTVIPKKQAETLSNRESRQFKDVAEDSRGLGFDRP
ncbi:hypothetical protein BJ875DRAFT_444810 [Amylocarpus encephaloides]|uniref:Uncharacterized protein n=1 Tax=Amylocarpus encephaloides TaxID=45428 RepID=A0A9P8C279_9HELO|nr:hypothetical protein BJ875DRAFT_444810 [Amylocarpus encephaloides]